MPHINARGVWPAPQLAAACGPYKYLAGIKAAAAEEAAAGDGSVGHASSEDL
jgi:hypothetical protein